jgi:uncharacterized protein (DUF2267 family)
MTIAATTKTTRFLVRRINDSQASGHPAVDAVRDVPAVRSDRLTGDEADDLLAQLPYLLRKSVKVRRAAMRLSRDEFVERRSRRGHRSARRLHLLHGEDRHTIPTE